MSWLLNDLVVQETLPQLTFAGDKAPSFAAREPRDFPLQLSSTHLEAPLNLRYNNTS